MNRLAAGRQPGRFAISSLGAIAALTQLGTTLQAVDRRTNRASSSAIKMSPMFVGIQE